MTACRPWRTPLQSKSSSIPGRALRLPADAQLREPPRVARTGRRPRSSPTAASASCWRTAIPGIRTGSTRRAAPTLVCLTLHARGRDRRDAAGRAGAFRPDRALTSVAIGRAEREEAGDRAAPRPRRARTTAARAAAADRRARSTNASADRMRPVGVEQRRRGGAVGEAEGVARRPLATGQRARRASDRRCRAARARSATPCGSRSLCGRMAVEDDLLHRRHDVVVEEAVHHPHVERGARIRRDQPHRAGMVRSEMLDDDARLDDRAAGVDEHRHALERPQRRVLGRRPRSPGASMRSSNGVSFS